MQKQDSNKKLRMKAKYTAKTHLLNDGPLGMRCSKELLLDIGMNHPCALIDNNLHHRVGPVATTISFSGPKVLLHNGHLCLLLGHHQNPRIEHQHAPTSAIGIREHDVHRVLGRLDTLRHVHDHDVPHTNGVEVVEEVLVYELCRGGEYGSGAVSGTAGGKIGKGADMSPRGGHEDSVGEVDMGDEGGGRRRQVGWP
jgi:hypothetical protein